jgi:hypothetical protein
MNMKSILQRVSQLILIFIFAFVLLVIIIEEDSWFKQQLEQKIVTTFNSSFSCKFNAKVSQLRLFAGFIELTDVHAEDPHDKQWHWEAKNIEVTFSWINLLIYKKMIADITIKKLEVASTYQNGQLAIMPHLRALTAPGATAVPFEPKRLIIQQGQLQLFDHTQKPLAGLEFRSDMSMGRHYRLNIVMNNGYAQAQDKEIINKVEAHIIGYITDSKTAELTVIGSCHLPQLAEKKERCSILGTFTQEGGTLTIDTPSHKLYGTLNVMLNEDKLMAQAQLPLNYLAQLITPHLAAPFDGVITLNVIGKPSDITTLSADISVQDALYDKIRLPAVMTKLSYQENKISGSVETIVDKIGTLHGTFSADLQEYKARGQLSNKTAIKLPEGWVINPQGFAIKLTAEQGDLFADYTIDVQNMSEKKKFNGTLAYHGEQVKLQGTGNKFSYGFLAAAKPHWHLEYLDCHLGEELVIAIKAESADRFAGSVGYPLLRFLLSATGLYAPGEGTVNIRGSINTKMLDLALEMKGGNIRLPYSYNLLQDVSGRLNYEFESRHLTLDNAKLNLHKGQMTASRITGILDDHYKISYLHVPLLLNNCFFSRKKEFFALFSGALTFQYHAQEKARLTGFVQLDRSHIQSNIFSNEFRKQMFTATASPVAAYGTDLEFDVRVITNSPLRVKTNFLEAAARINLGLIGSIANPSITGAIEILNGSFMFPYKPLFIKRGNIYFLPQQIDDPVIDLFAENMIKKYSIRMTVDGTAQHPRISFDSTPNLQEEQIIGLLLGGSEDGSLYLAMPTSVMTSIENLIFGPADSMTHFQRKLAHLFSPLKNLRIVPKFSDQTGRGGLRGALTIDINERLRGIVQQNFSLTEDVLLEVEYDLSDDSRIRAFRDERGDLGGEIESRWKF